MAYLTWDTYNCLIKFTDVIHKDVIRNDIFFQEVQEGAHALSKCFNYTDFFSTF